MTINDLWDEFNLWLEQQGHDEAPATEWPCSYPWIHQPWEWSGEEVAEPSTNPTEGQNEMPGWLAATREFIGYANGEEIWLELS